MKSILVYVIHYVMLECFIIGHPAHGNGFPIKDFGNDKFYSDEYFSIITNCEKINQIDKS